MKKSFRLLGIYVVVILCILAGGVYLLTEKPWISAPNSDAIGTPEMYDSLAVASITAAIVNPTFDTPEQMLDFRSTLLENTKADSILLCLPEKTLLDVYTVCSKKYTSVNKYVIMDEYRAGQSIYDNLDPNTSKQTTTLTDSLLKELITAQQTRAVTEESTTRDTTISGKKYKLQLTPYEPLSISILV